VGAYYLLRGEHKEQAKELFAKAFALDPRNTGAVNPLSLFYRLTRRYREAIPYQDLLISLEPDAARWYTMRSAVYLDWGRPKEAREALERAPRTDDRHLLWAWWNLEYWGGNPQAALCRLAEAPEVLEFRWGKYLRALRRPRPTVP
jgi:tetratricopeptide (TPR) repeat protein